MYPNSIKIIPYIAGATYCAIAVGCAAATTSGVVESASRPPADSAPQMRHTDTKNGLIIQTFRQSGSNKPIPVRLTAEYGFIIIHEPPAKPVYKIAIKSTATLLEFHSASDFEMGIKQLPKGVKITEYKRCTSPQPYDKTNLRLICEQNNIRIEPRPTIVCTCPD